MALTATRRRALLVAAVLAVLAYVPALTASPGRMVADSKLYLYLDPQRFLSDNLYTFDPRQFAGWVPHQHISYLWPAGPWYSLLDTLGVSDWIAHRLWIGTLMVVAGLGVLWAARLLGLSMKAAAVAAVVYQLSPYVLPYVSRTSVMLLPFAALGWIVGLTVIATRRRGWAAPAGIALIVLTVGSVNATALAMIIPAPLLWLVHTSWARLITVRRALTIAAQTAVLCLGVSMWWIAMLVIQARHGANVIGFSEALEDVALTSSAPEVGRGLGYWLFYIRDAFGPTTSASLGYLTSTRFLVIGYTVTLVCALGLVVVRWTNRRFAALLIGVGVVLAVGVHPTDDPAPLIDLLTGGGTSGVAEALRSSTRALPLVALGLGLAAGALIDAIPPSGRIGGRVSAHTVRTASAVAVAVLAVVNLPALWTGGFTDPVLDRDESPPQSWEDAAEELDAMPEGYRVLQLPGAEFGAFRWGYTVDQPLPGMTDRPLVTRDLLPLGSPAAMDLVFALDDRAQAGILEPESVAPIARLLGSDAIWGANDAEFERFRTARPEIVQDILGDAGGLSRDGDFGDQIPNVPERSMLDETEIVVDSVGRPISDVTLWSVDDPVPVIRAAASTAYLSGSADGLIDMAAAGVVDPSAAYRYTASADLEELTEAARRGQSLVITDSNRKRAHHWRSSQDVVGATETADESALVDVVGDERLDIFDLGDAVPTSTQTIAVQEGPVTAAASSYGEPFAYRPEHRAVMAIDGDPDTAWMVADRADAVGEFIRLTADEPVKQVRLRQPDPVANARVITAVDIEIGDGDSLHAMLDESSLMSTGQQIALPIAAGAGEPITITIAAVSSPEVLTPEVFAAVGFAEIDLGLGLTTEWIRPPVDALDVGWADGVGVLLTRLRTDPLDRWRDDPEPSLQRLLTLRMLGTDAVEPAQVSPTLRLHQRADDEILHQLLDLPTDERRWALADTRLTGTWSSWGQAAVDGDPETAWRSPFGDVRGHVLDVHHGAPSVTTIRLLQPSGPRSLITGVRVETAKRAFDLDVPAPDAHGWSSLELPRRLTASALRLVITSVQESTTVDPRYGEITVLPVGIAEIDIPRAAPPAEVPDEISATCRTDLLTMNDMAIGVSFATSTADLLTGAPIQASLCDPLMANADLNRMASTPGSQTGLDMDRVEIRPTEIPPSTPRPTVTVRGQSRLDRTVEIDGCTEGCWLVLGEGWNRAWSASLNGESLGDPVLIDGGFNGWQLPPGDDGRLVTVSWTAQGTLNWAFGITLITIVVALALVIAGLRRRRREPSRTALFTFDPIPPALPIRSTVVAMLVWMSASALLIDWGWGLVAGLGALIVVRYRRPGVLALAGWSGLGAASSAMVVLQRMRQPLPNGAWPGAFADVHEITLFAIVTLVVGASLDASDRGRSARRLTRP